MRLPIDIPMGLGEHLDELRRRLMWPVITVIVLFIGLFAVQDRLKLVLIWPLQKAIAIVGPVKAKMLGLPIDGSARILTNLSLAESATTAASAAFYLAIAGAAPVVLWHLWQFVAVGLTRKERQLAFIFVPLGVILFYIGAVVGFFVGMPYFYAFLIDFAAGNPTVTLQLRESDYIDTFFLWTVAFGLIMDIPWLIIVLVRSGLLTPKQIGGARKPVILANAVLAATITPDVMSMMVLCIPMQLLFEIGLIVAALFFMPPSTPAESSDG